MRTTIILFVLAAIGVSSYAEPTVDAFSRCLAENTTGKDRKDFARWLFVSMGAHPKMREISTISPEAVEDASKTAGLLLTKLLTDSCPREAQAAFKAVGSVAMQSAFGVVGELAMQELMTDKDVAAGMAVLEKYLDSNRIQAAIGSK